jgi:hypothetical protein
MLVLPDVFRMIKSRRIGRGAMCGFPKVNRKSLPDFFRELHGRRMFERRGCTHADNVQMDLREIGW